MASPAPSTDSTQGETQFIPQSDDEETLWKVIEITAERPKQYKVKWEGLNPETGRPWAQSWVPKGDCTDDLRKEWKKKLKRKEDTKKAGKRKSTTSRVSTPSTSTVTQGRNRSATATVTGSRPPESDSTSRSRPTKTPQTSKRKRRSAETVIDRTSPFQDKHSDREIQAGPEPEAGPSRPRKRRKIQDEVVKSPPQSLQGHEQESYEVLKNKKYGKVVPNEDEFEEEAWGAVKVVPVKGKVKGKDKAKERPEPEEEGNVPLSKMGPPRGVKKNSISTTQSKSKSASTSRSHSKPEVLPPLKLITKPKKSKPSPNRFRSSLVAPLHADDSPRKPITQLSQNDDNNENNMDNEDDMTLGYPDLPEQQHDALFLPSSDDGYDDIEPPRRRAEMSSPMLIDEFSGFDETQSQSPSSASRPAFIELPAAEPEPDPPGCLALSPEVPETQSQESLSGVEEPRPDTMLPILQSSSPGETSKSKSISKSKPDAPAQPVASTSNAVPAIDLHSRRQKSKPLHPVPQISPSQFHPHLPVSKPTRSPSPDIQEIEAPPSSIEYFSSPEKRRTRESRRLESIRNWGDSEDASGNSRKDTILGSDDALRARGQELANNEREKRERERKTARETERERAETLSDVMNTSRREPEFELDQTDESIIIQAMENAYVDLSGGGGGEQEESQVIPLAQEEESTQDLEREREQRIGQQTGESDVQQRTMNGWGADQEIDIETSAEQAPATDSSINADLMASMPKPKSTSKSTSAHVIRADVTVEELPPTLSPPQPPTPDAQALTRSQTEPPSHGLMDAMSLLNVKSEEIKKLQAALDHERHGNAALTLTVKDLEDALASVQIITSQPSPDTIALAELQTQRVQEQASWDAERATFAASLDSLKRSKTEADTDRDFFRDQYAQASGYVNTVRGENVELEQRALVAEGKAKDGVGMIKAMFEAQVKRLQGDLAQWKGIAELLQEKDRRTGDEIRRKAAEEPELRAKYAESRREIEKLEGMVFELSRERNVLKLKLSNISGPVERTINGTNNQLLFRPNDTAQGDELVYRCLWRPGGDSEPCLNIFSSSEDLEMHMYADQHFVRLRSEQLIPFQGDMNGHLV